MEQHAKLGCDFRAEALELGLDSSTVWDTVAGNPI
jgi:hypothetical protein